jgi:hypothetical protein
MKASLIYCKQFQAVRSAKISPVPEPVPVDPVAPAVVEPVVEPVKEVKKRGRKPNPKKEFKPFVVEEKEVILDFS